MDQFITYPKWVEISKKEYLKEESKVRKMAENKDVLEQALLWIRFYELFVERNFYEGDLLDQINNNTKPLYTKYYKRDGDNTYYLCGSEEYNCLKDIVLLE